jgi:site-specific DNA-methyltransferase (adenine-specific)
VENERKKADRNRTMELSSEEEAYYRGLCLQRDDLKKGADPVNHTILGDMRQICPLLPKKSVSLLICDPPYNVSKNFAGTTFRRQKARQYEDYTNEWLDLVEPLLTDTASIYVCCDYESSLIIGNVLEDRFFVRNRITWEREKGRGAPTNWKNSMEDIWYATLSRTHFTFHVERVMLRRRVVAPYKVNGKPKDWEQTDDGAFRDTYPSNFWDDITVPFWSMRENTPHPTQKSEKMMAKLILASSNEKDLVFDPFLGSGTTSVVAKKLHRNYIGIEQEALYCAFAEKRLHLAESDPSIQGYEDGVFFERNYKR